MTSDEAVALSLLQRPSALAATHALVNERVDESEGFRHLVVDGPRREAKGRERWVINKVRALCAWYSKGIDSGSYLRVRVNSASTLQELREIIEEFFLECAVTDVPGVSGGSLFG